MNMKWYPCHFCLISRRVSSSTDSRLSQIPSNEPTLGGRFFLVGLGLILALMGSFFVWLLVRSYLRARKMHAWPEVSGLILSSDIEQRKHDLESPMEYREDLSFGYEWKGERFTGDHLTLRGSPWSSDRASVETKLAEFPAGKFVICHVDPQNPSFAVLKTDSLAAGYTIWFPSIFVIGGLGIAGRAAFFRKS
jgi:hypothetical protein